MVVNEPIEEAGGDTTEATSQEPCYLFKLPVELREEIYKWCLYGQQHFLGYYEANGEEAWHSEVMINYRRGTRHIYPPLLRTCREIRIEAAPLWFKINEFFIYVEDLDARLLLQWTELCRNLVPPPKEPAHGSAYNPKMRIMFTDVYKWAKLMQWCKWVQQGRLELPEEYERTEAAFMAKGALRIAYNHRERTWEECEGNLECVRIVLDGCYKSKQCYCTGRIE